MNARLRRGVPPTRVALAAGLFAAASFACVKLLVGVGGHGAPQRSARLKKCHVFQLFIFNPQAVNRSPIPYLYH
jgi:hypothetical protein